MLLTNHPQLDLQDLSYFKFSDLTFLRLMSFDELLNELLHENWAKLCKKKKNQLQSVSNVMICINERFVVENSGTSCMALIFN